MIFVDAFKKCSLFSFLFFYYGVHLFCWLEPPEPPTTYKQSTVHTIIHRFLPLWSMERGCASVPAWPIWQWPAGCCHHIPVSSGCHWVFHESVHTLVHWSKAQPPEWGTAPTLAPKAEKCGWENMWIKYTFWNHINNKNIQFKPYNTIKP